MAALAGRALDRGERTDDKMRGTTFTNGLGLSAPKSGLGLSAPKSCYNVGNYIPTPSVTFFKTTKYGTYKQKAAQCDEQS